MNLYTVPFYKSSPFLRIIIPFIAGILVEWSFAIPPAILAFSALPAVFVLVWLAFQSPARQFSLQYYRGLAIHSLIAIPGAMALFFHETSNDPGSLVNQYRPGDRLVLRIEEPLSEKPASFKTTASVNWLVSGDVIRRTSGTILLYLAKDTVNQNLEYGDVLISPAPLRPVAITGNPAAFDYREFCYFQGIHFQLFAGRGEYLNTGLRNRSPLKHFIYSLRERIVSILQKNIPGQKESGLAQALLIGYKDNLDKELVQSYSNTGVVHVIAISGLHLGLIYSILVLFTNRLKRSLAGRWIQLILVLTGIWIFSLLAGASASVVRSAVMFSCIATGNTISRRASVYNSLAASAFLLLNYNPYWLWDTGFQLSYAAVLSIVIYQKPVLNAMSLQNKLLRMLWKTCAVTLSAQILTTPVSVFYFHQFPLLFLVTNLVAIPLSGIILLAEIILCFLGYFDGAAALAGKLTGNLITVMNFFVELIDDLPAANWRHLQISYHQYFLLYLAIALFSFWLLQKIRRCLPAGLLAIVLFLLLRSKSFYDAGKQQKLVVFNINRISAVDIIKGRNICFIADSVLLANESQLRFHVIPSRIMHRAAGVYTPPKLSSRFYSYRLGNLTIAITGSNISDIDDREYGGNKIDILVLGGYHPGKLVTILGSQKPKLIVFDSSTNRRKVQQWMQECRELGITGFAVQEQGAFVMTFN